MAWDVASGKRQPGASLRGWSDAQRRLTYSDSTRLAVRTMLAFALVVCTHASSFVVSQSNGAVFYADSRTSECSARGRPQCECIIMVSSTCR